MPALLCAVLVPTALACAPEAAMARAPRAATHRSHHRSATPPRHPRRAAVKLTARHSLARPAPSPTPTAPAPGTATTTVSTAPAPAPAPAPAAAPAPATATPTPSTTSPPWYTEDNPINGAYLGGLPFGTRSFWLQPWRAYLDTPPATQLLGAAGINFNVSPTEAPGTAQALAAAGFRRARVEIGWNAMSFANPTQLADPTKWYLIVKALKDSGIRPLILLNANDSAPGPTLPWTATVTQSAPAGSRTVQLDAASAAQVVPGLSGFDNPVTGTAAQLLITSVSPSGLATLSQPLPIAVSSGAYPATTLRFAPFASPTAPDGSVNASYAATQAGWLSYVKAVIQGVSSILGNNDFDVEVWNELSFGSAFLNAGNYYNPLPATMQGTGSVPDSLLAATVNWIRDPTNGVSGIGIGDGFANQTPFASPATIPAGVTALDKHPYKNLTTFGPNQGALPNQPVNALGQGEGTQLGTGGPWVDTFAPGLQALFPEYYLTGLQTETLVRDLSPITTTFDGEPHGRNAAGRQTQTWITEYGLDPTGVTPQTPSATAAAATLSDADRAHLQAKATMRFLASYVNKGATAVDFYAAKGGPYGIIPSSFYSTLDAGGTPPAGSTGETLSAVGSFLSAFSGAGSIATPRSLALTQVADQHNYAQWQGDGSSAHPSLLDREMLAVLPFQLSSTSFAIPVYVMTENLATLYRPDLPATQTSRYDLPDETFRITLSGLNPSTVRVSEWDPYTRTSTPVGVAAAGSDAVALTVTASDYPRVLQVTNG